ncbi:MAG: peptide deformylase [Candidatus Omnitrophica bacterium]|nr:peptide deformylase [Candidatus Omnitrophota bacterium]
MTLRLRYYPDSILKRVALPIEKMNEEVLELAQAMVQVMHRNEGVGLAAPQVGIDKRLLVYDASCVNPEAHPRALINPIVTEISGGLEWGDEGCLSFPGVWGSVRRPRQIHLLAQSLSGEPVDEKITGFEARIILHELDHLDGILFVDRLRWWRRYLALRKYQKPEEGAEPAEGPAL